MKKNEKVDSPLWLIFESKPGVFKMNTIIGLRTYKTKFAAEAIRDYAVNVLPLNFTEGILK